MVAVSKMKLRLVCFLNSATIAQTNAAKNKQNPKTDQPSGKPKAKNHHPTRNARDLEGSGGGNVVLFGITNLRIIELKKAHRRRVRPRYHRSM